MKSNPSNLQLIEAVSSRLDDTDKVLFKELLKLLKRFEIEPNKEFKVLLESK